MRPRFQLTSFDIFSHRFCDEVSGYLICLMVTLSPWALGTTEPWSIRIMNAFGFTVGTLVMIKWLIRETKNFRPLRWDEAFEDAPGKIKQKNSADRLISFLKILTLLILAYCLIGAWNARATFDAEKNIFRYHQSLPWLPQSTDSTKSWFYFWMYLGLAGTFWGVQDWLLGMTAKEETASRAGKNSPRFRLPARLRMLLWILSVNGLLLGIEGIVQRMLGSNQLLFLIQPRVNPEGITQFGPYAYRSNAAQYFNLLWPVCLAFWWQLQRSGGARRGWYHLLLVCAATMAACPFISSSRGSALTAAAMLLLAVGYLIFTNLPFLHARQSSNQNSGKTAFLLTLFLFGALGLGWYFGWDKLEPRLTQLGEGYDGREEMYAAARPMTREYPWFGTGVGTFATAFRFYRFSNSTYWPEQLHNDWLETRITFGWIGTILILSALAVVFLRRFVPGKIFAGKRFVFLGWLALSGCLVQALFDFPLQIYSIVLLFLVICAILINFSGVSPSRLK